LLLINYSDFDRGSWATGGQTESRDCHT